MDFEIHLKLLFENIEKMREDFAYYKSVAAEMRVLVSDKNPKKRLFFEIMRIFDYKIENMKNDRHPYTWTMLNINNKDTYQKDEISLENYCERCLAVGVEGVNFTVNEFVRLIAQEDGSSHDSNSVDRAIAVSGSYFFNGFPGHISVLEHSSKIIRYHGVNMMKDLIKKGITPRYNWGPIEFSKS